MTTGWRYGGGDAREAGLVDDAVEASEVTAAAIAMARSLADKGRAIRGQIKETMYAEALAALRGT